MATKEELNKTLDDMGSSVLKCAQEWAEKTVTVAEEKSGVHYPQVLRAVEVRKLGKAFYAGYMEAMESMVKESITLMGAFK